MSAQPIGEIIDNFGVRLSLADDDQLSDFVVIAKVVEPDGSVRLATAWSQPMSWIERLGMLHAALCIEEPRSDQIRDQEDD